VKNNMANGISPKIDCVFKRIFGVEDNVGILADFLTSMMKFSDGELDRIFFLDKELPKDNAADKASVLDVRVRTAAKTEIDIEIQLAYQQAMADRSLYYWSKMFSSQIESGNQYRNLHKTVCVNILNYDLFDTSKYHVCLVAKELEENFMALDKFRIDFLELRKAERAIRQGQTGKLLDWLHFINISSDEKEALKMLSEKSEPMKKAVGVLLHLSEDEYARREALQREMFLHDQAELKAEGLEEGMEKGRIAERTTIVRQMYAAGMPISQIASVLHLPESQVKGLVQ
jgi:predicted transposase/invertase (TIGR01784 family)